MDRRTVKWRPSNCPFWGQLCAFAVTQLLMRILRERSHSNCGMMVHCLCAPRALEGFQLSSSDKFIVNAEFLIII